MWGGLFTSNELIMTKNLSASLWNPKTCADYAREPLSKILEHFLRRCNCFQEVKKRPREPSPVVDESEPAPKKKAPVTRIGQQTDLSASLPLGQISAPKLEKFTPPPRRYKHPNTDVKRSSTDDKIVLTSDPHHNNKSARATESKHSNTDLDLMQLDKQTANFLPERDTEILDSKQQRHGYSKIGQSTRDTKAQTVMAKKSNQERKISDKQHNERILAGSSYQTNEEQQVWLH